MWTWPSNWIMSDCSFGRSNNGSVRTVNLRDVQRIRQFKTWEQLEKDVLLERLRAFRWNKTHAALSLGLSYKTIYNRMRVHDIPLKPPVEFARRTYPPTIRNRTLTYPVPFKHVRPTIRVHWVVDGARQSEQVCLEELVLPTFYHTQDVPVLWMTKDPPLEGFVDATELARRLFPDTHP